MTSERLDSVIKEDVLLIKVSRFGALRMARLIKGCRAVGLSACIGCRANFTKNVL